MNVIEPVEITLDKPRKMQLSMGALMRAERELNKVRPHAGVLPISIFELINTEMKQIGENISVHADFVTILLWASLTDEDPELTLEQAQGLAFNPVGVIAKLVECINKCFLKEDLKIDVGTA